MADHVEVSFEIDEDLYHEVKKWCENRGTTIEELTYRFIVFCADHKNADTIDQWVKEVREKGEIE